MVNDRHLMLNERLQCLAKTVQEIARAYMRVRVRVRVYVLV